VQRNFGVRYKHAPLDRSPKAANVFFDFALDIAEVSFADPVDQCPPPHPSRRVHLATSPAGRANEKSLRDKGMADVQFRNCAMPRQGVTVSKSSRVRLAVLSPRRPLPRNLRMRSSSSSASLSSPALNLNLANGLCEFANLHFQALADMH